MGETPYQARSLLSKLNSQLKDSRKSKQHAPRRSQPTSRNLPRASRACFLPPQQNDPADEQRVAASTQEEPCRRCHRDPPLRRPARFAALMVPLRKVPLSSRRFDRLAQTVRELETARRGQELAAARKIARPYRRLEFLFASPLMRRLGTCAQHGREEVCCQTSSVLHRPQLVEKWYPPAKR